MCSLNIDIPPGVMIIWSHGNNLAMITPPNGVITAGSTTTLVIGNPRQSDVRTYSCSFTGLNLSPRFFTLS